MTPSALAFRYAAFAGVATLVNLAVQRIVLLAGTATLHFAAALVAGTLAGLVVKYLLDKRWIFHDAETGLRRHGRKFTLYSVMGIATTCIFWGSETLFWLVWRTEFMREAGAVLGLAIGYSLKYRLDRRFVFAGASTGKGAL